MYTHNKPSKLDTTVAYVNTYAYALSTHMKLIKNIIAILSFASPAQKQPTKVARKPRKARKPSNKGTATCVGMTSAGFAKAMTKLTSNWTGKRPTKAANPPKRMKGFATSDGILVAKMYPNATATQVAAFMQIANRPNPKAVKACKWNHAKGYVARGGNATRVKIAKS